jgi:hypothetical protein
MIPIVVLGIEIAYLIAVVALCLGIYFKTRGIYRASRHEGIFHFRNIFLYFSFAYLLRLILIFVFVFYGPGRHMHVLFNPFMITFLLVGYFSTMAILSVGMTVFIRKINISKHSINNFMHIGAILLSVFVFAIMFTDLLWILHTLILLATVLIIFLKDTHISNQNKLTYLLLLIFWIINLFTFNRYDMIGFNVIIYTVSVLIFLSIYLRVKKRLFNNVKKKK